MLPVCPFTMTQASVASVSLSVRWGQEWSEGHYPSVAVLVRRPFVSMGLPPPHFAMMPRPPRRLVFWDASGETCSGSFCHFFAELELALKPAMPFREGAGAGLVRGTEAGMLEIQMSRTNTFYFCSEHLSLPAGTPLPRVVPLLVQEKM